MNQRVGSWHHVKAVAAFEFLRVFKVKDVFITLVMFICGALFFVWLEDGTTPVKAPITVHGDAIELENADYLPFRFHTAPPTDEEELRARCEAGETGTLVLVRSIDDVEVVFRDEKPSWYPHLMAMIANARQVAEMKAKGISTERFAKAKEATARATVLNQGDADRKTMLKNLAFYCVGAMMLGIFIGNVHLFTSITAEKQNRVTESIMSAIPAQSWIDGKLLGLSGIAAYGLLVIFACWLIANEVYGLFLDKVEIPFAIVDPIVFLQFLVLATLGFLLWFAFFGAVASTIDDPNTSSRSVFMFLPGAGMALAWPGIDSPHAGWFQFVSIFPLTSSATMPIRLILGDVAWWEFPVALVLLVATIHLFRRLAGKIFATGMLTHGSDLTWGQVLKTFKDA